MLQLSDTCTLNSPLDVLFCLVISCRCGGCVSVTCSAFSLIFTLKSFIFKSGVLGSELTKAVFDNLFCFASLCMTGS